MSYQIRHWDEATTPRRFDTLAEVFAYVAGAIDVTDYGDTRSTVGPWTLWWVEGQAERRILPAGQLLARGEHWRRPERPPGGGSAGT